MKNYYQILSLEEGATLDEIKAAYREYVVKFHPDKHNGDEFFKERFQEVQEAYDYLLMHYNESKEFTNGDKKETESFVQPLKSTDIELTCLENEICEGDTITFSWRSVIPCQASIIIDNGYRKQEYNDIENGGSKSIVVKRIQGKYITITLWCYNEKSEASQSIYIYKKEKVSANKQGADSTKKENARLVFKFILAIIIPLIVYFGIGWIAKDIYFSMWKISDNTTIQEIYNKELFIYGCVALGYVFICHNILDNNNNDLTNGMILAGSLPIIGYILCAYVFPMSEGAAILNTALCIIGQIIASVFFVKEE